MTPGERITAMEELRAQCPSMSGHGHGDDGLRRTVRVLERLRVTAVVVGGYALAFHAKPRFTITSTSSSSRSRRTGPSLSTPSKISASAAWVDH